MLAQLDGIAVFHFQRVTFYAIEPAHHAESLLVADDLHVGIELLDEGNAAAVVGLHVVDDQIVDRFLAYHLLNVLQIRHEEVHLNRIDEAHFVVVDEIGVVGNSVRKWPKPFEKALVAVVHSHIIGFVCDFYHGSLF